MTQVFHQKKFSRPQLPPEAQDYPSEEDLIPPEYRDQDQGPIIDNQDEPAEFDLMRILVMYGPNAVSIDDQDDKGEKIKIETSVAELICHELAVDELVFSDPLYNKLHQIISDSLTENTFLKTSYFKRLEDQSIVQFVTEIEMNQHEISHNWITKHKIFTNTEKDKINQAVMGSIYAFKSAKVEKRIREIQTVLRDKENDISDEELMDLLAEQVSLEQVKILISKKLGRIIIR